jgi:small subunit ribosomal protein S4
MEKQKLRMNYGLTESQLQRLFREAKASRAPTGNKLLELLERRLDNAVFRAGFAPTAVAARQLVRHRHVQLNGRLVNIPSIRIRAGIPSRLPTGRERCRWCSSVSNSHRWLGRSG